ncbi:MAG TPA: bifunctional 2-C-methyl-D-erythritol 4-phosphate cytidylyltransferase/2-C-methyl-D-erythritol 2,4-cyclodiphosphate synthase [Rickettsiales bacterium]|nr:bifunctional 2-C-methyl-D-erythritol 4-phosphate cytidylyltransferase/2-C-methyl-D-erythritol 2,4-cyclodiphosphate synthase [Rickettsiales bacterium]
MNKSAIALIVAAGESRRAGGTLPKQYQMLEGKSLLRRSAEAFLRHPGISGVRVVINPAHLAYYQAHTAGLDLLPPINGGATRQQSVALGLASLADNPPEYVLVHDAARPNVSGAVITRILSALAETPAAIPALPVFDTLKHVEENRIIGTVERQKLFRAQTPQGFHYKEIYAAHRECEGYECTDDAAVAEHAGVEVKIVPGSEHNYKVTTKEDLEDARILLAAASETRIGTGFDAHRLTADESKKYVTLCGIQIASELALAGHSDADVGLHALVDAILGSIGAGDIGQHFPPSDPKWKGADSSQFVTHACSLLKQKHGRIINADITLICERPHISPHRAAMVTHVAKLLEVEESRISIKATTTEKMGFTGRGEGIAAQAAVSVKLPTAQDRE